MDGLMEVLMHTSVWMHPKIMRMKLLSRPHTFTWYISHESPALLTRMQQIAGFNKINF